jgi:hypothetical protein
MVTLADADQGRGYALLFTSTLEWLETSRNRVLEKFSKSHAKVQLENVTSLLNYLSDLLAA